MIRLEKSPVDGRKKWVPSHAEREWDDLTMGKIRLFYLCIKGIHFRNVDAVRKWEIYGFGVDYREIGLDNAPSLLLVLAFT